MLNFAGRGGICGHKMRFSAVIDCFELREPVSEIAAAFRHHSGDKVSRGVFGIKERLDC